jgi:hypothetical protein
MSLVTRLSSSPRGWEAVDLVLDVAAQREDRALDDAVEQVTLQPAEERRHHVDHDDRHQHPAEQAEVDALSRDDAGTLDHVGVRVVARRPCLRRGLLHGRTGGQLPADHPGEDHVGGAAEHERADGRERHAEHAEHDHRDHAEPLRGEPAQQPAPRRAEGERALRWHAHAGPRRAAAPGDGHLARGPVGVGGAGHATSSGVNCDATISP